MGLYSVLHPFSFSSDLNEVALKEAYWKFMDEQNSDDRLYLEIYDFVLVSEKDGIYEYELEMDDHYAKHYALSKLAEFISKAILPGSFVLLTEDTESGERGGYLVLTDAVHSVEWIPAVNGLPLDEFLKEEYGFGV